MKEDRTFAVLLLAAIIVFRLANPVAPGPGPAPVPASGLMVLMVEETLERSKLPAKQLSALLSTKAANYLDAKTAKGPDGSPEWQRWDDDMPVDKLHPTWRAAMERAKQDSQGRVPWLLISNGRSGVSMPFPATEDDLMAVLQKYGG